MKTSPDGTLTWELRTYTVHTNPNYFFTHINLPSRNTIPALAHPDDEREISFAQSLGYGNEVAYMSFEHEFLHMVVAKFCGQYSSPTLEAVASKSHYDSDWAEEELIFAVQRYINFGEFDPVLVQIPNAVNKLKVIKKFFSKVRRNYYSSLTRE